jgi:thiol-disulfide isomerase/thioredoxin
MNGFAALFVLLSVASSTHLARQSDDPLDYVTAYRQAQAGNKPMLVLVTAEWCAPCQMLKRTTLQEMMAQHGFKDFHFAMVDVDLDPDLAAKLTENKPVPQFIIFERKGTTWNRRYSIGYHTVSDLRAFLAPSIKADVRLAGSAAAAQSR